MFMARRLARSAPVLILGLGALSGCPNRDVSAVDPNQAKEQQKEIPVNLNRDVDILWVVDNSSSMGQEQEALALNFPEFIRVLETIEGGLPNIRMGIVSSDVGTAEGTGNALDDSCEGQGDDGRLLVKGKAEDDSTATPCPDLTDGASYIEDVEDGTERKANYTGTLAEQFSCMAQLGTTGCGFEQHLESMRRALDKDKNKNPGFLRDDAFLAVIFIQDEDDCSASDRAIFGGSTSDDVDSQFGEYSSFRCFEYGTVCDPEADRDLGPRQDCAPDEDSNYIQSVSSYIEFLKGVKGDPSKVIVAAITAPPAPVTVAIDESKNQLWTLPSCVVCADGGTDCPGAVGSGVEPTTLVAARPGIRMNAFLNGFPQRATFQSICAYDSDLGNVDFSGALTQIGLLLKKVVGNPCLEGKLTDTDSTADGVQPDCRVSDVRDLNLESEQEFPIPSCDDSGPPCWDLIGNDSCNTDTNLALEIDRGSTNPPDNTTVVVRCLVE